MIATGAKILLIEDNPADAYLLQDILLPAAGGPYELCRADRMATGLEQLSRGRFDAILLDLMLPDSHGIASLERVQKATNKIPIIVLTGIEDEQLAINAIRHGAQDYLVKGTVDGRTIAKAIRYAIDRQKADENLRRSETAYAAARTAVDTVNAMEEGVMLINMDGTVRSANPALLRMIKHVGSHLEGSNFIDLLATMTGPEDLALIRTALAAAIRGVVPELREITLTSAPSDPIPAIPRMAIIRDVTGKPATVVLTVQDITTHRRAEDQHQIVTTLLALFAQNTSRKEYLDAVVKVIHQWSGCRCIGIRIANEDNKIPYEAYIGFSEDFIKSECMLVIGKDECACTRIIARHPDKRDLLHLTKRGSFRWDNMPHFMGSLSEADKKRYRGACLETGFSSVAIVPVRYRNTTVGAIHFADEQRNMTSVEMIGLAETTFAPIVGEAIHRFTIETELRSLSLKLTLAEARARRELAVALHDTVGQSLALGKIKLGALHALLAEKEKEPLKVLREIREMFDEAVQQTRSLSFELSPPILYELGLGAAVEWVGEEFSKRHGFQVRCHGTDKERSIAEAMSVLFFQSARELLTNITKHAGATEVNISLLDRNGQLVLKIIDNGRGMEPNVFEGGIARNNSFGLFSIRERMKQIGGTFEILSEAGQGTTAILTAPLQTAVSASLK
ncbi:MAG: response regulator [bacterium]